MKARKVLIVLFIMCFPLQVWHSVFAGNKKEVNPEAETIVITAYGEAPRFDVNDEYASHPLGDEVARQWHVIESMFLQRADVTVGFGYNTIDIQKPQIYHSLCKINSYYKKEVAASRISAETAQKEFSHLLAVAYDLYFWNESDLVESKLKSLKDPKAKIAFLSAIVVNRV